MTSVATGALSSGLAFAAAVALVPACGNYRPTSESELASIRQSLAWSKPQAPLASIRGEAYDLLGHAVALSGGVALAGSPYASARVPGAFPEEPGVLGAGTATLFLLKEGRWREQRTLQAPTLLAGAQFGLAVAASSSTLAIGAPFSDLEPDRTSAGLVYAVQGDANWTAPVEPIVDPAPAAGRLFGRSVAVALDTLVVGAPGTGSSPGQAVVFRREGVGWIFDDDYLVPPVIGAGADRFGMAVALDPNTSTVLVGAPNDSEKGIASGAAHVFERLNGTWVRGPKLLGSDTASGDAFGAAVAINGVKAIIGSTGNLGGLGAAYVFVKDTLTGTWRQEEKLTAADATASDAFGNAVALMAGEAWVGSPERAGTGAVLPFHFDSAWSPRDPVRLTEDYTSAAVGTSVSASGASLLIGAPYTNDARGAVYVLGLADGSACEVDADCSAGHCVGRVCCDTACDNRCDSCLALEKVAGTDGSCGPVKAQSNPRAAPCPTEPVETCGATGLCDGQGACALQKEGTECKPPGCDGDSAEDPADSCDGQGVCVATPPQSCGGFRCSKGQNACLKSCRTRDDCGPGKHCDAGESCQLNRGLGARCSLSEQCTSEFCADGVCCNSACDGQCEACAESNSVGACIAVQGSPRGKRPQCDVGTSPPCSVQTCDGRNVKICAGYPGAEQVCQDENCSAGSAQPAEHCDGRGACATVDPVDCGPYACGEHACLTECQASADCSGGTYCDGTHCVVGTRCSADNTTAFNEVGIPLACSPFKCDAGQCLQACTAQEHCAAGDFFCNPDTGRCEPITPAVAVSQRRPSTSCSAVAKPEHGSACILLLAIAVSARRWRHARGTIVNGRFE